MNLLTYVKKKSFNKSLVYFILFAIGISVLTSYLTNTFPLILVLAVVSAPFILLYGTIHKNFLITLFILGIVLFSRGFAHLNVRIGVLPFYITEAILIVTIGILFLDKAIAGNKIKYLKNIPLKREFALFYLIGFICLIRGFLFYSPILTLRHSAMIYYSVFYFLIPILFNDLKKIEKLFKLIFIACIIVTIAILFKIGFPINKHGGLGSYNYLYLSLAVIFESLYFRFLKRKTHKVIIILIILMQLLVVYIGECRGAWVSLFASLLFLLYLAYKKGKLNKRIVKTFCSAIVTIVVLLCSVYVIKPSLFEHLRKEAASIIFYKHMNISAAGNVRWRMVIWKDIVNEISKKPLFGWGFGKGFLSSALEERGWLPPEAKKRGWIDPHNSFLSMTYKIGVIGFLVFLLIIMKSFKRTIRFIKYECKDEKIKLYTTALLACVVFILVLSFFEVILEAPHMGSFLWISMGLIIALNRIYYGKKQNKTE